MSTNLTLCQREKKGAQTGANSKSSADLGWVERAKTCKGFKEIGIAKYCDSVGAH